jgi:amidase
VDAPDLAFAGIARQAELVRAGEVSPRELVELYIERIRRIDPELNAFRIVYEERALAEADQAQGRVGAGDQRPLLGVPVAVKDNLDVAGDVTTHGTNAYGEPARSDSELVRRLRAAGAIVLGRTHMPELAIWPITESLAWGATRNPWSRDHSPGGSSGGSGAAVAAGLVGAAVGTDGGGSIRVPASCCGVFGLKPQRGRVSFAPDSEHWLGLSAAGGLTRGVLDSALFLDAIAGSVEGDAHRPPPPERPFAEAARNPPGKLRIALSLNPMLRSPLHEEVRGAVHDTAELLRTLGHEVRERDPDYGEIRPLFVPRWLRGIHEDAKRMPRPRQLERRTRQVAFLGGLLPAAAVERARRAEAARARRMNEVFADHDVVLTPTLPRPPVRIGKWDGRSAPAMFGAVAAYVAFTSPWNLTGQPAASVPAGFTSGGLPIGVQLVGRPNDEATLLALAAQMEAERPWTDRRPPAGAPPP